MTGFMGARKGYWNPIIAFSKKGEFHVVEATHVQCEEYTTAV